MARHGSGQRNRRLPTRWAALGVMVLVLASQLLTACASEAQISQAHTNKAKLDQELTHARTDLFIPDRLLTPVTTQEKKAADGDGGIFYNYDDAAKKYDALYSQLLDIEKTALATTQQQAQADMQAFGAILNERRGEGFTEIDAYQTRYDEAQQAFTNAKTPDDFAHVSDLATAQTQALQALWPAYQKLQLLQSVIKSLASAGINTQAAQQLYNQDLQVFRSAASADRYQALSSEIDAQIVQIQANATTEQPHITKMLLDQFQASIDLLAQYVAGFQSNSDLVTQYGNTPTAVTFQKQHDDDATQLASAHTLDDYTGLAKTVTTQTNAMSSPLIRARAMYDYMQLVALTQSIANRTIINEQPDSRYHSGQAYPLAYEYLGENGVLDNDIGLGKISKPENYARTDAQFQAADFRVTSLEVNLRAMLDNYDPATDQVNAMDDSQRINPVHEKPHASDLQLMQYYHITQGKVIMVSLREQVARFYENGNMVAFTYVTTGDLDVPSVPGFWTAINRHSPADPNTCSNHPNTCSRDSIGNPITVPPGFGDIFTSPEPPGSPGYYNPTPIHFDVAYHEFGFWLHDAYWRHQMGPETNLPHRDPNAFSGGSHGCVNMPYVTPVIGGRTVGVNMEWVYNWTPLGTPIILY